MVETPKSEPIQAEMVGQPTERDRIVDRLQDLCQAAALYPVVAPFAVGLSAALGMVRKQGEENLQKFVKELFQDVQAIKEQISLDRMDDPDFIAALVKVFKAVQFESREEKRSCYRAALLNSLTDAIAGHPQAQREFMLNLLDDLGVYAIVTLKVLSDPKGAIVEFQSLQGAKNRPAGPPFVFWEMMFVFCDGNIEQPTFEAVLTDLDGKRLIHLGEVSTSPRSVQGTDPVNASRMMTDFGREFVKFITLP